MAKNFIKDKDREVFLNGIYNRTWRGKSTLVLGRYGSGKSTLLKQVKPRKRRRIEVESLSPVPHLLADILTQSDYTCKATHFRNMEHLDLICRSVKDAVIIIDEANDLRPQAWPYLKRIMNAEIPVVLAGLPIVRNYLREKHEDILSRLKIMDLTPLDVESWKMNLKVFEPDAIEVIYGAAQGNMRVLEELVDDCMDKIRELKLEKVSMDIVTMFI